MDAITQQRLTQVHPKLRAQITQVIEAMAAKGLYFRVTEAFRTAEYQDQLYAKGRDAAGNIVDLRKVVTYARGSAMKSWHQFGMAVDMIPSTAGPELPFTPNWNANTPPYREAQAAARELGLVCGADWHGSRVDPPHYQLGGVPVTPTEEIISLFKTKGLEAVWALIPA